MADYDVAIAGDGIAGLTAALFSARYGRSTVVFGSLAGGELLSIEAIEDFPGFASPVSGYELCPTVFEQASTAGAEFKMAEVDAVERDGADLVLRSAEGDVRARSLIVASGAAFAELDVPGEEGMEGRGISHCASCDGPIFGGKPVGVVGAGNDPVQEALTLSNYGGSVHLFYPDSELEAQETYKQRVVENPAITVYYDTVVTEVLADGALTGVRVRNTSSSEESQVELSALFVYAGLVPRSGFLGGLVQVDERGAVVTDGNLRTDVPGVFAAGIVRAGSAGHAVTSAGDGATAAIAAHRYLLEQDGAATGGTPSRAVA